MASEFEVEEDEELEDRLTQIENILRRVIQRIPVIEGLASVTRDGLPIASVLNSSASEEDRVSAMTAATLALAERVVLELDRGTLEQVIIKGSKGLCLVMDSGPHAVLVGVTSSDSQLGLILLEMKRAAARLAEII